MKTKLIAHILYSMLLAASCYAAVDGLGGNWSGESICVIRDSPCHDEQVIYHITEPDSGGKLTIQADKLVNGQPEEMGTLECTFDKAASLITCLMKNGKWEFTVTGNSMKGTLKLPDGQLYRNISVKKDAQ